VPVAGCRWSGCGYGKSVAVAHAGGRWRMLVSGIVASCRVLVLDVKLRISGSRFIPDAGAGFGGCRMPAPVVVAGGRWPWPPPLPVPWPMPIDRCRLAGCRLPASITGIGCFRRLPIYILPST
jgi:hypothetical protein